jgi:sensor domain CHASE-containing protein
MCRKKLVSRKYHQQILHFFVFSHEKDESDASFLNQIMIIMIYAIQIIERVHIFHKTYKKSQTNIRHQVLNNHE